MLSIFFKFYWKLIFLTDTDTENLTNGPTDIIPIGTLKQMEPQKLPVDLKFPVTNQRRFKMKYLSDHIWLEYSISQNAAFCYACRQFSASRERDNVFKYTGFSNWKFALETNKGFKKHEKCGVHLNSMAKWTEAIDRQKNKTSVIEMASGNVLEYRRNYMKKIVEVCIEINIHHENSFEYIANFMHSDLNIHKKYLNLFV